MRIYVAGPYSAKDKHRVEVNVANAVACAENISRMGHTPFIPHLTHFWHKLFDHDYEFWMQQDLQWLRLCDAVFRMPGVSNGADREVAVARTIGIPVFYHYNEIP